MVEGPRSSPFLAASSVPHLFFKHVIEECLKININRKYITGSLTEPKTRMSTKVRRSCFGISNDAASLIRISHSFSWFMRPRAYSSVNFLLVKPVPPRGKCCGCARRRSFEDLRRTWGRAPSSPASVWRTVPGIEVVLRRLSRWSARTCLIWEFIPSLLPSPSWSTSCSRSCPRRSAKGFRRR